MQQGQPAQLLDAHRQGCRADQMRAGDGDQVLAEQQPRLQLRWKGRLGQPHGDIHTVAVEIG